MFMFVVFDPLVNDVHFHCLCRSMKQVDRELSEFYRSFSSEYCNTFEFYCFPLDFNASNFRGDIKVKISKEKVGPLNVEKSTCHFQYVQSSENEGQALAGPSDS